jgi:hypothetical protein
MDFTLLLADALWPSAQGTPPALHAPALARALARGDVRSTNAQGATQWLCAAFGALPPVGESSWPAAPYALAGGGGDPADRCWWSGHPLHAEVGRNGVLVAEAGGLTIADAEAQALCAALNTHFDAQLAFVAPTPLHWYACPAPALAALPPSDLRRQALLTELQMLLHAHPVNAEREARGEPTINSVAFGDGGIYRPLATAPYDAVAADSPLARGLALAAGLRPAAVPDDAGSVLAAGHRRPLVVIDAPVWPHALAAADECWIAPLLAACFAGRCRELRIVLTGRTTVLEARLTPGHRWRWWRRAADLSRTLAEPA